jgi:hypothetical protein
MLGCWAQVRARASVLLAPPVLGPCAEAGRGKGGGAREPQRQAAGLLAAGLTSLHGRDARLQLLPGQAPLAQNHEVGGAVEADALGGGRGRWVQFSVQAAREPAAASVCSLAPCRRSPGARTSSPARRRAAAAAAAMPRCCRSRRRRTMARLRRCCGGSVHGAGGGALAGPSGTAPFGLDGWWVVGL